MLCRIEATKQGRRDFDHLRHPLFTWSPTSPDIPGYQWVVGPGNERNSTKRVPIRTPQHLAEELQLASQEQRVCQAVPCALQDCNISDTGVIRWLYTNDLPETTILKTIQLPLLRNIQTNTTESVQKHSVPKDQYRVR